MCTNSIDPADYAKSTFRNESRSMSPSSFVIIVFNSVRATMSKANCTEKYSRAILLRLSDMMEVDYHTFISIAMFNLNDSMGYYHYPFPADIRKGFYILIGLVNDHVRQDVKFICLYFYQPAFEKPESFTYGKWRNGHLLSHWKVNNILHSGLLQSGECKLP